MKKTIDETRLKRLLSKKTHLRSGAGHGANGEIDVCIMQAVGWLTGGDGKTDSPECASPAITRFCIRLNDSPLFAEHRDLLKPFAAKIVNTKNEKLEPKRGYIAADYAVRVFAPIWLRADPKHRFDSQALALESCKPITNKKNAELARDIAREARRIADAAYAADVAAAAAADVAAAAAAAAAAYAAYAAAYAAAAADAAAAAYAAAAADAAAAYAADAAYAAAAAFRKQVFEKRGKLLRAKCLECLQALIDAE